MIRKHYEVVCWSDSTLVLSWLCEHPSNLNIFVANRVARIQSLTTGASWRHIPTSLNSADLLSRGSTPIELLNSALWNSCPSFLHNNKSSEWPATMESVADLPEWRRIILAATTLRDFAIECKFHNSFLYPPQRGYISFVNTFVTPRNNDLGPYVPWRHLISAKF